MQQIHLPKESSRRVPVDVRTPPEATGRFDKLKLHDRLRRERCSQETALEAIRCSCAARFRWPRALRLHGLAGLAKRQPFHNHIRPHMSLAMKTPLDCLAEQQGTPEQAS